MKSSPSRVILAKIAFGLESQGNFLFPEHKKGLPARTFQPRFLNSPLPFINQAIGNNLFFLGINLKPNAVDLDSASLPDFP